MLVGLLVLVVCQLAGEFAVSTLDVPVPGPVVGMVLFVAWLWRRRPSPAAPEVTASDGLLRHLQLLFVPAGVGVVQYLGTLRDNLLPVLVALVVSWFVAIAVTAGTTSLILRLVRR